jgi:hypothetical protein
MHAEFLHSLCGGVFVDGGCLGLSSLSGFASRGINQVAALDMTVVQQPWHRDAAADALKRAADQERRK